MKYNRLALFLAVFYLLGCGGGGNNSAVESASESTHTRIINGTVVEQSDYPQYVKVINLRSDGRVGGCTGTIIGWQAGLTAAHCVEGAKQVFIQTGDDEGPLFEAIGVYSGANYGKDPRSPIVDDIALVITAESTGRPALPLLASRQPVPGDVIMVIGFGLEDGIHGTFGTLRVGQMVVSAVAPDFIEVYYDGSTSNVCFGDSGGPMVYFVTDEEGNVVGPAIAGVVSAGTASACEPGDTTYFTNVQPYISSILEIVPDAGLL